MAWVIFAGVASFAALFVVARRATVPLFEVRSVWRAAGLALIGGAGCLAVAWIGSDRLFAAGSGFVSASWLGPSLWALWGGCAGAFVGALTAATSQELRTRDHS